MTKERLYLYDTTLRDGQQTQGVDFSARDKIVISEALDALGVDYIEGGWPGANPTDSEFFASTPNTRATMTAFGMTKRAGRSAANDETLAGVVNAGTTAVCLVGKTHDFHVSTALGIGLKENLQAIGDSITHLVARGREALFDAEHFFDGYKANPEYAMACLEAAMEGGARWVVLCDTNGGTLPHEISTITGAVCAVFGGGNIGIHTHNDTEHGVANSLAAVLAGARQIQGTINGLGERCGNANLTSLIPTLLLKEPFSNQFETGVGKEKLTELPKLSRLLDAILNRRPDPHQPYTGKSAFAHKAGLHASAIAKNPSTYEHIPPEWVGNERILPMSNQAGRANLIKQLADAGISVDASDSRLGGLLTLVKERQELGYAYDTAQASFELLAMSFLGQAKIFFDVLRYRVLSERRHNEDGKLVTASEAIVTVMIDDERHISASESLDPVYQHDQGPVNALFKALWRDLGKYQGAIDDVSLDDFRVRIIGTGTEAVTRVHIDFIDVEGMRWTTVGVSANIVDASMQALEDGLRYKLQKWTTAVQSRSF